MIPSVTARRVLSSLHHSQTRPFLRNSLRSNSPRNGLFVILLTKNSRQKVTGWNTFFIRLFNKAKGTSSSKFAALLTNTPVSAELASLKQSSKRSVRDLLAKNHRQKFAGPNPFAGSGREETCERFIPQKHDEF